MSAADRPTGDGDAAWAPPSPPGHGGEPTVGTAAPAASDPLAGPADDPTFGDRVRDVLRGMGVSGVEVPFDTPGEAVRWWFRPLAERRTWRAFAAIFAAALLAPLLFGLSVAIVAVTASLSLIVVGLLLVPAAFAAIGAFATLGRDLAGWGAGQPIPPRPLATGGTGILGPLMRRLTDETRWRQLAFVGLEIVVAPLFLAGVIAPISLVFGLVSGLGQLSPLGAFNPVATAFSLSIVELALAVPMLGAAARLVRLAGGWRRSYVAALLGPDRESELEERVEELSVQRDQVLDAVAAERRRIERNLHDGVQQQLVALGIDIGRASRKLDDDPEAARQLLDDAREKVRASIGELRLIGRGLHPAVLGDRGLDAALSSVVANSPIPIAVHLAPMADGSTDLPPDVAETAYYVASESVTNVLKYAQARAASIRVEPDPGLLPAIRVSVHDDGRGGADERRGSGIAGMRARVEAVDGGFRIDSPPGGPTVVTAVIPLRRRSALRDESAAGPPTSRAAHPPTDRAAHPPTNPAAHPPTNPAAGPSGGPERSRP